MAPSINIITGLSWTGTGTWRLKKTLSFLISSWFFSFCMQSKFLFILAIELLQKQYSAITFQRQQDLPSWRIQFHCSFLLVIIENSPCVENIFSLLFFVGYF